VAENELVDTRLANEVEVNVVALNVVVVRVRAALAAARAGREVTPGKARFRLRRVGPVVGIVARDATGSSVAATSAKFTTSCVLAIPVSAVERLWALTAPAGKKLAGITSAAKNALSLAVRTRTFSKSFFIEGVETGDDKHRQCAQLERFFAPIVRLLGEIARWQRRSKTVSRK